MAGKDCSSENENQRLIRCLIDAKECKIVSKTEAYSLKWLKLYKISWSDPEGKERVNPE